MQWGSLPFHQQSLRNLALAMLQTRKLCAVMVDTLGREVYVRREYSLGEDNWPKHESSVEVKTGGQIQLVMDPSAKQTDTVFPINYSKLTGANCAFCRFKVYFAVTVRSRVDHTTVMNSRD